jgi:AraC-like DNA-binding protein
LTIKAEGKHIIDFKEYILSDHQVFFVNQDQIHQVIEQKKTIGYAIVFSDQFLVENNIPFAFIHNLKLFNDFDFHPPLLLNDHDVDKLKSIAEEMDSIYRTSMPFKIEALGSLVKLFLIHCNNLCSLSEDAPHLIETKNLILGRFKKLVNNNFSSWHSTIEYAKAMNISSDHLNRTIKALTGKTAKEHIQNRIIIAAKRMRYFSELSNKEISYRLGFNDPANFSAFFKKHTGLSPTEFSNEQAAHKKVKNI